MLQSMLQEQYSLSWTPIVTDTPSPLFQKPFPQPNEIMKSMIENYWLLFEHLKNGKHDGPYTYLNLMLSWSTHLETKWFNQMHYLGDQISAQKKTRTTKTL